MLQRDYMLAAYTNSFYYGWFIKFYQKIQNIYYRWLSIILFLEFISYKRFINKQIHYNNEMQSNVLNLKVTVTSHP